MIYDGFIFRDEIDLIEMRIKYLYDEVDFFVLVESDRTFNNVPKPYHFEENKERFKQWEDKIRYIKISPDTSGLDFSKKDTQYTPTSAPWQLEYAQRNSISKGLYDLSDNDTVMISDVDEFPDMSVVKSSQGDFVFTMPVYYYYVNMKANKGFGESIVTTRVCDGKTFKDKYSFRPQGMRDSRKRVPSVNAGWHFSFLGGADTIRRKIKSFSHTEYNSETYYSDKNIKESLATGKDIFNRGITYRVVDPKKDLPDDLYDVVSDYPDFINSSHE